LESLRSWGGTRVIRRALADHGVTRDHTAWYPSRVQTLTRSPFAAPAATPGPLGLHLVFAEHPDGLPLDRTVPITAAGLTLGRAPEAEGAVMVLAADGWASRTHARVRAAEGHLVVEDLGARNGTFVEGARISRPTRLSPGQLLQVGSALFVCGSVVEDDLPPPPADFACRGAAMRALWDRILRLAPSDAGVLILGELGTGKTRIAQFIHALGPRADRPFVAHNCSALPRNLEEATLFGVVAGFIPTVKAQDGLLVRAGDGTLFLDELAELPEPAQAKLLDAFDPNAPSFLAVGGSRRQTTRCRLITATNRDVFALAQAGVLRHDLLSRLAIGQVEVPPLRQRREDILPLFAAALARHGVSGPVVQRVEVATALLLARWSENVRGLETLAHRVALGESLDPASIVAHADRGLAPRGVAAVAPIVAAVAPVAAPVEASGEAPKVALEAPWPPSPAELLELLARHHWEVKAAAEAIGRRRETLSRLVSATFGSREGLHQAWQAYRTTGRVPDPPR